MPAPTPAAVKDGWHAVDQILGDLERLATSDLEEATFYTALFERLKPLGCSSVTIWQSTPGASPRVAWRSPHSPVQNGDEAKPQIDPDFVLATMQAGEPKLTDPFSSTSPGRCCVVPWSRSGGTRGALQAWLSPDTRPVAASGYLNLFAAIGEVIANFLARQDQVQMRRQLDQSARIGAFTESLHESLDLDQTAYRIANDGRVLVGCDRVAVAVRRGGHYKVIAVSGAEHVHRRSESVHQLGRLIDRVVASGQPMWHGGHAQDLPPEIAGPLAEYLDLSPAIALAVIPLVAPPADKPAASPPLTVLVFEQYSQQFVLAARDLIESLLGHARLALTNCLRVRRIPAHRFWLALGREGWLPAWATRTTIALVALAVIIAALVFIPADVWIKTRGELQPAQRNEVFAPRDGIVTAVHVNHGQSVKPGEKLLEMRSPELDLELQRVQGELETTRKRLAATQSERLQFRPGEADARLRQRRLSAEEEQLQQQVAALELRDKMLKQQLAELLVKSPAAGDVITWNVEQQLTARPLRRGDALLTVADVEGPWQLELRVPSRRAGRLLSSRNDRSPQQEVSFMLATEPGRTLQGTVKDVAQRVETDDAGESYLLVTVEIQKDQIPRRVPGATALAKIRCSRASLGEALFHDLLDAARLWLPF